jgi:hypothetical protein
MTISIQVSINGNYKVPVTVQYGDEPSTTEIITGRGHEGPFVKNINYYHGSSTIVSISVGPESYDDPSLPGTDEALKEERDESFLDTGTPQSPDPSE